MIILLFLVRATYMYGVGLHAHPVRGESHNQRNTTGGVATTSPPFYNEPHRSHVLCVKADLRTTFTSWSQHHFDLHILDTDHSVVCYHTRFFFVNVFVQFVTNVC